MTALSVAVAWIAVVHAIPREGDTSPVMLAGAVAAGVPATGGDSGATATASSPATSAAVPPVEPTVASTAPLADVTGPLVETEHDDTPTTDTTSPSSRTRSFDTGGGIVTITCDGKAASLVSAAPRDGYTVTVVHSGPDDVDVEFRSATDRRTLHGWCSGGSPAVEVGDDD